MNANDLPGAAALLGRLLAEVEEGRLTANGPAATAVARRLEGALMAVQALTAETPTPRHGDLRKMADTGGSGVSSARRGRTRARTLLTGAVHGAMLRSVTRVGAQSCPSCGGALLPVVFGYPSIEMREAEQRGEVILGGCMPGEHGLACRTCRDPWGGGGAVSGERVTPWQRFLDRNQARLEEASPYQWRFAVEVLAQVPGLEPDWVTVEVPFTDGAGKRRRMDFAIQDAFGLRLAVEVDGFDKTGSGTGMTPAQFTDFLNRQNALTSGGWTLLRFSNGQVKADPDGCIRALQAVISKHKPPSPVAPRTVRAVPPPPPLPPRTTQVHQQPVKEPWSDAKVRAVQWGTALLVLVALAVLVAVGTSPSVTGEDAPAGAVAPVGGECPSDFPVKGNQSGKFHLRKQRYYDVTVPEVCFDSPASAEAAGYVASKV